MGAGFCANYNANYAFIFFDLSPFVSQFFLIVFCNKIKTKSAETSIFSSFSADFGAEGGIRTPARFYPPTPLAGAYRPLGASGKQDFANYNANYNSLFRPLCRARFDLLQPKRKHYWDVCIVE